MKGLLDVQQPFGFGDINVKLTEKAKASQVIEITDDDDDESAENEEEGSDGDFEILGSRVIEPQEEMEIEDEAEEEGHFEEQFGAGHAAYDESEHDELYDA
jgi:meiotic recombination protein REC8